MIAVWVGFVIFVIIMLSLDLGVFHRKAHVVSLREAVGWSAFWISLALSFSVFVYFAYQNHWFGLGHAVGSRGRDSSTTGTRRPSSTSPDTSSKSRSARTTCS